MLYSQGVPLDRLGVPAAPVPPGGPARGMEAVREPLSSLPRHAFALWLDHSSVGVRVRRALEAATSDLYYDRSTSPGDSRLRPRALFDAFNIELLATTEGPHEDLAHHAAIRQSGWRGRVVTTYRPDAVVDPEHEDFRAALTRFGELTGEDVESWPGYLAAHRRRRADFRAAGATATDHGHPTALTADLDKSETEALFRRIVGGAWSAADAELFRAQMVTEMAAMSVEDGMVMQIHPAPSATTIAGFTANRARQGRRHPDRTDYVRALKPLLAASATRLSC